MPHVIRTPSQKPLAHINLRIIIDILLGNALLLFALTSAASAEIIENHDYNGEKVTIRYVLWGGAGEVASAAEDCREFVQLNPDIRVDVSVYPWGQYWAKLQTQAASGLAPDIITLWENSIGIWIERGALLNLNDLARQHNLDLDDYYQAAVDLCLWDDNLYALPMGIANRILIYNIDKFEQSGIPRSRWPKPDQHLSWTEFKRLTQELTLRNPDGTFAQLGMAAGHDWQWTMFRMYGGDVLDQMVNPTRSTVAGNIPLEKAVIEIMAEQYADRTTAPMMSLAAGGFPNLDTVLQASDKFCMALTGTWVLRELRQSGLHFGLSPLPQGPQPSQLISLNALGIYSGTKHPQAAWKFLHFKATGNAQQRFGSQLKGVPALKAAAPAVVHNDFNVPDCQAYLYDLDIAVPRPAADNTYVPAAFIKWYDQLEQSLFTTYQQRLNNIPRDELGNINPHDYQAFVADMQNVIDAEVPRQLNDFHQQLQAAFRRAHAPAPSFPVRVLYPLILLPLALALIPFYVFLVRKFSSRGQGLRRRPTHLAGYLFLSPWLFGIIFFVTGPILIALYLSFTDWNMIKPPQWTGLQNYLALPSDEIFRLGIRKTFTYAAFAIPISFIGGLFTAGLLTCNIRGTSFFKAVFYFPSLFTGAAAAVLWVNMFNREYGVINHLLSFLHIPPVNWLDADHAFYTVVLMNIFWVGGAMIIYYAGMKQIPRALYEAADIDGAGPVRKFLCITIPMLSPVILFMVIMTTIAAFQVFTPALFFAADSTQIGRPGVSLRFYSVNIYDEAFNNLRMGRACAYAFILFIIIFIITLVQLRLSKRFVHSET